MWRLTLGRQLGRTKGSCRVSPTCPFPCELLPELTAERCAFPLPCELVPERCAVPLPCKLLPELIAERCAFPEQVLPPRHSAGSHSAEELNAPSGHFYQQMFVPAGRPAGNGPPSAPSADSEAVDDGTSDGAAQLLCMAQGAPKSPDQPLVWCLDGPSFCCLFG
jgi:hypothetical protein